jgi:dolichyl-phosphate beta-glucosyltransferase
MPKVHLSVIIPAHNEEERIPQTLKEIDKYLSKQNFSYEIIVVSGGSTDRTCEVVENLKSEIKNLKLLCEKESRGKGFVVKKGILFAKGRFRLFTDADNSTPIEQIEKFWPEFEKGADIVIASRDIKGAILDPPQPLFRRFVGEVFKFLRKIIVGLWEIEDTQCGFKCFRGEVAEKIFPKMKTERFAFDPEILLIAKKEGYKIKEVPVYWKNDLRSKVKFTSMFEMLFDLFKIRLNQILAIYG